MLVAKQHGLQDGADSIILAEHNLYGGRKKKAIATIFQRRGIL
jgi:hypothetical protein